MKKVSFISVLLRILRFSSAFAQIGSVQDRLNKGDITFKGGRLTLEDAVQMTGVASDQDCEKVEYAYLEKYTARVESRGRQASIQQPLT
jgi:hypothetical protein